MNLPIEAPDNEADLNATLVGVLPVVRAILMKKSGMSLAASDLRRDNQQAIDLCQDVVLKLWERLAGGVPDEDSDEDSGEAPNEAPERPRQAIHDFKGYAAMVAYNAWSDHLREKYPLRTSLKNRLRRFLMHQPKYAAWVNAAGNMVCGFKKWQLGAREAAFERVQQFSNGEGKLPQGTIPRKHLAQIDASDWDRLLDPLFIAVGGPLDLDDLVGIAARLIGVKDIAAESLSGDDGSDAPAEDLIDTATARPDAQVEIRQTLGRLWLGILALKPDYRVAYLLNIPGPGKSRGDIETFPIYGIATIQQIGAAVGLNERQFAVLWEDLDLTAAQRTSAVELRGSVEKFAFLWGYLPIADLLIGKLLGLQQQQIINRRMLACNELRKHLSRPGHGKSARHG